MKKVSKSVKIFFGLVFLMAVLSSVSIFLPQSIISQMPEQDFPVSRPLMALISFFIVLIVYGGTGFIGLKLSTKIGLPELWDTKISLKNKILSPIYIGIIIGIIFIVADTLFVRIFSQKSLHYIDFPFSIIASINAGIGEEIIFRLFYISFFVWLFSKKIYKNKYQNRIFWIVTIISTLTFALSHIPSIMALLNYKTINEIPVGQIIEIIVLNSLVSIVCAINFKKNGIISAMGIHLWTDMIYHVVWWVINNKV